MQLAIINTKILSNLIHDLLDMAQINAGKFKLQYKTFDLINLIQEVVDLMKVSAQIRNLYLKSEIDP